MLLMCKLFTCFDLGGTYTNSSSNYRDNPRGGRGGFRGDRGRGRGGMSNGYSRGGRGGDRNYGGM